MLIGREAEIGILRQALQTGEAELIAIYGRRRVGKTFLIRNVYAGRLLFDFSGMHNSTVQQQLESFSNALASASKVAIPVKVPSNWIQAFEFLKAYLAPRIKKRKSVVFLMNFPGLIHTNRAFYKHLITSGILALPHKIIL